MLTKPWNLYIFRHSSLTEKSKLVTEAVLRKHAGWTMSSEMPQIYIHLQDESSDIILEKYGIAHSKDKEVKSNLLKSTYCTNCNEPNIPASRFCISCKMILSYDAYENIIEEQQMKEKELNEFKQKHDRDMKNIQEQMNQMMKLIQLNPKLAKVKPEILIKKTIYTSNLLI